jgi:hypothetical protein
VPGSGCNSWKGKHFDPFLRDLLAADFRTQKLNTRHQISLYAAGYLALFRQFGFQVTLSAAGLLSRRQFFLPNTFLKEVPLNCKMVLTGQPMTEFNEERKSYWSEPFNIQVDGSTALIVLRNMSFRVPLSKDPTKPFAKLLRYAPSRLSFRPDLTTIFD